MWEYLWESQDLNSDRTRFISTAGQDLNTTTTTATATATATAHSPYNK